MKGQGPFLTKPLDGTLPSYDITAAAVIKATKGRIAKIVVQTVGTAGNLTVNDCATTGAAAATNQVASIPYTDLTAGQVIALDWPCATGITVSAVPTGGVFAVAYE